MSPIIFLVAGLLIVWLVFTGRATNVWNALLGTPSGNALFGGASTGGGEFSGESGGSSGGGERGFR